MGGKEVKRGEEWRLAESKKETPKLRAHECKTEREEAAHKRLQRMCIVALGAN